MADEQLALFDDIAPPQVRPAVRFPVDGKARYRRLKGCAHVYCDDCLLALHQNRWVGPAPLGAAWEKRIGTVILRLCQAHYQADQLSHRRAVA